MTRTESATQPNMPPCAWIIARAAGWNSGNSEPQAGGLAQASLVSSTRFIELDAAVWLNNTVRVMARDISGATFDLAAAALSVQVVKRRVP